MANILYTDYYLPEDKVTTGEYLEMADIPVPKIFTSKKEYSEAYIRQNKVEFIYIENKLNLIEIFSDMLSKLFERTNIDKDQIQYIFYTKAYEAYYAIYGDGKYHARNTDHNCINIPYYLTEKFRLRNACVIFNDGKCCSVAQSMELGGMCCDKKKGYSLILCPSISGRDNRYMNNYLIGDGVGMMLLGSSGEEGDYEIMDTFIKSNGEMSHSIAASRDHVARLRSSISTVEPVHANYQHMFRSEVLDPRGIRNEDIKAVITLNVKYMEDKYRKLYPGKPFTENMPYGGHISDVDIIRNLKDLTIRRKFDPGDYILLLSYGTDYTGLEYSGVLLRYRISP